MRLVSPLLLALSLLASVAEARSPAGEAADAEAEAVCTLRSLFTAEKAYFGEKDRYSSSARELGFLPLPCLDGTRAEQGAGIPASCHYGLRIVEAGAVPHALRLEAEGLRGLLTGTRFVMDAKGELTREGRAVPTHDCEAWRQRADPLWRYRDVQAEHGCTSPPPSPSHPCHAALAELAALARAGVGTARQELAEHPVAGELFPTGPATPWQRLCGQLPAPDARREEAALTLERQGALVDAVLSPRCSQAGARAGLARLLPALQACPGPRCAALLAHARRVGAPGLEAALASHARRLAPVFAALPASERREALGALLGSAEAATLERFIAGQPLTLHELQGLPRTPLVVALVEPALASSTRADSTWRLATELGGGIGVADAVFARWVRDVPCGDLHQVRTLPLPVPRLRALLGEAQRCPGDVVQLVRPQLAAVPPHLLPALLAPLPPEPLRWLGDSLGLGEQERLRVLLPWLLSRDPSLLEHAVLDEHAVRQLLLPANAAYVGGRSRALDLLLGESPGHRVSLSQEDAVLVTLFTEALRPPLPPRRARSVAGRFFFERKLEQARSVLAPVLARGEPAVIAAVAAGLAELSGASLPAPAALACVRELTRYMACAREAERALGAPPPGGRALCLRGCEHTPLDSYCTLHEEALRSCGPVCGGELPTGEARSRLYAAAGSSVAASPGVAACTFVE